MKLQERNGGKHTLLMLVHAWRKLEARDLKLAVHGFMSMPKTLAPRMDPCIPRAHEIVGCALRLLTRAPVKTSWQIQNGNNQNSAKTKMATRQNGDKSNLISLQNAVLNLSPFWRVAVLVVSKTATHQNGKKSKMATRQNGERHAPFWYVAQGRS